MPRFQDTKLSYGETICLQFLTLSFLNPTRLVFVALVIFDFQFFGEAVNFCFDGSKEGYRFENNVTKYLHAETGMDCILKCLLQDELCRSVNFRKSSVCGEEVGNNCELLHAVHSEQVGGLHKDEHYDHYILLQPNRTGRSELHNKHSCKELIDENPTLGDGIYNLQANYSSEKYPVYCQMTEISGCTGAGWTLVMKIDGSKETFDFDSPLWTNKESYKVGDGLEGLTEKESKLASYWNTPFKKICLGTTVNGNRRLMQLDYAASSLFSVIAGERFQRTFAGRGAWKSLISDSSLQFYCNKEGFYISGNGRIDVRLGLLANNNDNCGKPDSCIGFGISYKHCGTKSDIGCGNIAKCGNNDNGDKLVVAFGYVLVQ